MTWDTDWLPVRIMTWIGRVLLVGLLVLVASLPIVTLPAAIGAGAAAHCGVGGSIFTQFWEAFRAGWRRSLPIGLLMVVMTVVVGWDLIWATSRPLGPVTTPVVAAALILAWLGSSICLLGSARLAGARRVRDVVKGAALEGARSPLKPAALLVATAATVLVALVCLPLVVVALGLDCVVVGRMTRSAAAPAPG